MTLLDNLPNICTISRRNRTQDEEMGSKDAFTVIAENVPCWRQQASTREVQWWQARNEDVSNKIYFAADPKTDPGCVIDVLGQRWDFVAQRFVQGELERFDVVSDPIPDSSAGFGILYRVMVRRTQQGLV